LRLGADGISDFRDFLGRLQNMQYGVRFSRLRDACVQGNAKLPFTGILSQNFQARPFGWAFFSQGRQSSPGAANPSRQLVVELGSTPP
jgi:hypothetical protein